MSAIFSYGISSTNVLNLDSSEITNLRISRAMQVNTQDTLSLYEITQAGVLRAQRISIDVALRKNAYIRFDDWLNKFNQKPLEKLIILNRDWGDYHFENINFTIDSLDGDGQLLETKMTIDFIQNINFSNI